MPSTDGELQFRAVAQMCGLAVRHAVADRVTLVGRRGLVGIQRRLLADFAEQVTIVSSEVPRKQVWRWAVRRAGGRFQKHRLHPFFSVGPPTALLDRFVRRMSLPGPPDLIPAVYRGAWDRAALAGLAPLILDTAAAGDAVAKAIVAKEASELARTAAGAAANAGLPPTGVPVALAGGLLLHSGVYRTAFLEALVANGLTPGPVTPVPDPAVGAVVLARI